MKQGVASRLPVVKTFGSDEQDKLKTLHGLDSRIAELLMNADDWVSVWCSALLCCAVWGQSDRCDPLNFLYTVYL